MNPQFNREELKNALKADGISYVFLGKELGARSEDPACYENGKVKYDQLARTDSFANGIERVKEGMKKYCVALMCAEKEPLECHRTILVARRLVACGIDVQHIHGDGKLESHADALMRLVALLNLPQADLFNPPQEDLFAAAYRAQEERIAYDKTPTPAYAISSAGGFG